MALHSLRTSALVLLSFGVALEIGCQLWLPSWQWLSCWRIADRPLAACVQPIAPCEAVYGGFTARMAHKAAFRLGADGVRATLGDPQTDPAAGRPRLAIYGASNVFGLGVTDGEAWPARLQLLLAGRGKATAVLNRAVVGHDARQQLQHVQATLQAGEVALVTVGVNDFIPIACAAWAATATPWARRSGLVRAYTLLSQPWQTRPDPATEAAVVEFVQAWRHRHADLPVRLLMLEPLSRQPLEHLRRLAGLRAAGFEVLDASAGLGAVLVERRPLYWDERGEQLNALGHAAVAEAVAAALAAPVGGR